MAAIEAETFEEGEEQSPVATAPAEPEADPWYADDEDGVPPRRGSDWLAPALAALVILAWTGFFLFTHRGDLQAGTTVAQWRDWIAAWSLPCILVASVWLLVMRTSTREAGRFADSARALSRESEMLEARLSTVNRELSLAREFLAAQSRGLETLGRVAGETISQHADRLEELVVVNGERVDRLSTVSATAVANMEHLRNDLPVVANAARDVANQIGQAGDGANRQLEALVSGFANLESHGANSERRVAGLQDRIDGALSAFETQIDNLEGRVATHFTALRQRCEEQDRLIEQGGEAFEESLAEREDRLAATRRTLLDEVESRFAALDEELARFREALEISAHKLATDGEKTTRDMDALAERLEAVREKSEAASATIAQSGEALQGTIETSREGVDTTHEAIVRLTDECVRMLELIQAAGRHGREVLPEPIHEAHRGLEQVDVLGREVAERLNENARLSARIAEQTSAARRDGDALGERAEVLVGYIETMRELVASLDTEGTQTASAIQRRLGSAVSELDGQVRDALSRVGAEGDKAVTTLVDRLRRDSGASILQAIEGEARTAIDSLAQSSHTASEDARAAANELALQLGQIENLTANLEARIEDARARAQDQVDADFGRRAAMIAESLNSNAIDIARSLSADVSDTAWARYLRGDRGVFTRRAVTLLEPVEAREIAELYDGDGEFRDHVSRFIHDFEALLRTLLSVRDGNALAVTLLGSDMGKLYVALAQAIERLRDG